MNEVLLLQYQCQLLTFFQLLLLIRPSTVRSPGLPQNFPEMDEESTLREIARLESKLKVVRRKGNLQLEAQICNLLGKKYEAVGQWRDALRFHYFDWELGHAMEDWEGQMLALTNMGSIYKQYPALLLSPINHADLA